MVLYYLAGQLINTDVRHRWDCLTPEALYITVCWLGPGQWVLEVEDEAPGDGQQAPFTAYRQVGLDDDFLFSPTYVTPLTTGDALALLARYEHGPDIWTCACDFCVCECGVSWHIHPRWERPLPVPRPASCPVLAGRPLLPPHHPPHNGA